MKILFLNHPEADYGGAFLYTGLCEIAGAENVYDYPTKYSYHGVAHRYSTPSIENGFTTPFPWMKAYPFAWSADEQADATKQVDAVRRMLAAKEFDLIIVESCRVIAMSSFMRFENEIRLSGAPVVLHDGEDGQHLCGSQIKQVRPALHLKRELSASNPASMHGFAIKPFPFSFPVTDKTLGMMPQCLPELAQTEWDVAFMCGSTFEIRERITRLLLEEDVRRDLNVLLGSDNPSKFGDARVENLAPWDQYMIKLTHSRSGISARGYGYDTCRMWEVAISTLLITERLDLQIPDPYVNDVHCLIFSSMDELRKHLSDLADPEQDERFERLRMACLDHTMNHHTSTHRAASVLAHFGIGN